MGCLCLCCILVCIKSHESWHYLLFCIYIAYALSYIVSYVVVHIYSCVYISPHVCIYMLCMATLLLHNT